MWKLLQIIFVIKFHIIYGKLVGDHICLTEESHLVNVTETYVRNITLRNYKWCYNFPPRCSFYTIKRVNDSRVVEQNQTRTVEKCCHGFIEEDKKCIPICQACKNGKCENGHCLCNPGYKGDVCDVVYESEEQASNCSSRPDCDSSNCQMRMTLNFEREHYKTTTTESTSTTVEIVPIRVPVVSKNDSEIEITFSNNTTPLVKSTNPTTRSQLEKLELSTMPHRHPSYTFPTPRTTTPDEIKIEFTTNHSDLERNAISSGSTETTIVEKSTPSKTPSKLLDVVTKSTSINITHFDSHEGFLIPVEIKYDRLPTSQRSRHIVPTTSSNSSVDYLMVPKEGFTKKHVPFDGGIFMNLLTLVGISVAVAILLVFSILVVRCTMKNKQKEKFRKNGVTGAVSAAATSIFHEPLPEPPTTQNPLYLTPIRHRSSITDPPIMETRFFCNMNTSNRPMSDCRDYVYDHPPSTGSYRAASIIEPSEIPVPTPYEEPVYDEIRYREDIYEGDYRIPNPLSIYINTFERTKF